MQHPLRPIYNTILAQETSGGTKHEMDVGLRRNRREISAKSVNTLSAQVDAIESASGRETAPYA